jgi:hypothetical protein
MSARALGGARTHPLRGGRLAIVDRVVLEQLVLAHRLLLVTQLHEPYEPWNRSGWLSDTS